MKKTKPNTPGANGNAERSMKTLMKEWA